MNFFNYKSCKNKEADIGKKGKLKKKIEFTHRKLW